MKINPINPEYYIEDLMKAMEYIRRLAYYEELELAKAIKKAKLLT